MGTGAETKIGSMCGNSWGCAISPAYGEVKATGTEAAGSSPATGKAFGREGCPRERVDLAEKARH